ncbi:transposon Tf2-9 polyprotein [Trichonephila clavipes]|nr:transposon Tf2-9 polyprotein [Trichonephila clavipes]
MRDLAHKGAVDDSSLIDYIINAIPNSSNNKIILNGSKTLSEFKDKLKIYETLLNSKHSKQFPDKRFRDYENSTSNQHRIEHKRFTNQQPICYLCGLKGHKSTLCPNKERGKKCCGCKNFGRVQAECPKNSRKITPITNHKINTQVDRTVNSISILTPPKNPMHVEITISKIPITALCDTVVHKPPKLMRKHIKNLNTALPAKIHVVNDETIPLDAIIGIDFLQQTQFTFGRDGIRIFRDVDECKNDDVLFIPNYARIARPLSDRDNVKFKFGPTEIASFQELKNILSKNPALHVFQQGYPLELHTDASSLGFGTVLLQKSESIILVNRRNIAAMN